MLKIILLIIGAAIVAILGYAATKPDTFRYTHSRVIKASPAAVFAELNSPKRAEKWSEWVAMEPEANYAYDGPESGVGAAVSWEGKKSGTGKMTVIESTPNTLVRYKMEFVKPMEGISTIDYALAPSEGGTRIDFAMYGDNNFMGKLMSVFIDCEKMIVDNTEKSFAKMETVLNGSR